MAAVLHFVTNDSKQKCLSISQTQGSFVSSSLIFLSLIVYIQSCTDWPLCDVIRPSVRAGTDRFLAVARILTTHRTGCSFLRTRFFFRPLVPMGQCRLSQINWLMKFKYKPACTYTSKSLWLQCNVPMRNQHVYDTKYSNRD